MANVRAVAPHFERALDTLARSHAVIAATRGVGMMRALELKIDAQPVIDGALAKGLLVNRTAERVVRLLPPLTATEAEIDDAVSILDGVLANVKVEVTR
jgi:acetylornithine/succinyldiaminopimelate/putrescine aminotransferase